MNKILCINAGGIGDLHGIRQRELTRDLNADTQYFDLDKEKSRLSNFLKFWAILNTKKWDLIFQESTGSTTGLALIVAAMLKKQKYIISSGDPVQGYFKVVHGPFWGWLMGIYEKILFRKSFGFIGWTPYLTGRALELGAPRAITVEGSVDLKKFLRIKNKKSLRQKFHLKPNDLVLGVIGSIKWVKTQKYCYGLELIEMLKYLRRKDVYILIVGDGDGLNMLKQKIPERLSTRVIFTGKLSKKTLVEAINTMDAGFVTQTLDELGNFRLSTKLPEYLACGTPVWMSPIPGFYDYDIFRCGWALPPLHPSDDSFHRRLAAMVDKLSPAEIEEKSKSSRVIADKFFDYKKNRVKFTTFIKAILEDGKI